MPSQLINQVFVFHDLSFWTRNVSSAVNTALSLTPGSSRSASAAILDIDVLATGEKREYIVTLHSDGVIKFWSVDTGKCVESVPIPKIAIDESLLEDTFQQGTDKVSVLNLAQEGNVLKAFPHEIRNHFVLVRTCTVFAVLQKYYVN